MAEHTKEEDELDADLYGDLYGDDAEGPSADALNRPLTEEDDEGDVREVERGMGVGGEDDEDKAGAGGAAQGGQQRAQQGQGQPPQQQQHHQQYQPPQQQQQYSQIPTFTSGSTSNPASSYAPAQGGNPIPTFSSEGGSGGGGYGGGGGAGGYGGGGGGGGGYGGRQGGYTGDQVADEGKMFIGGLNWDTTDETLRNYFAAFGPVASCTIMRDPQGRSRGFAFLTFENPASVNAVMAKEHVVDNKIIDPKRAIPRAEHARSQKIFVGGLAATVNNHSLREFFVQFGNVTDAHVMMDRETMRNKGFGFVTFEDENGVERSMSATGMELDGKMIEVKKAQPRGQVDNARSNMQQFPIATHSGPTPVQLRAQQQQQAGGYGAGGMGGGMTGGMGGMAGMGGMGMGGMGGMAGGFDPQAMAMMYQKMMMQMMSNPMGMGMAGMMGGNNRMGGMNGMMGAGGMGMGAGAGGAAINPMMMGNRGATSPPNASITATPMSATPPNAPRGPAAMRQPPTGPAAGNNGGAAGGPSGGQGQPARYSTQGQARSRPY